jgi:uncharacterized membrane protein
VFVEEVSVETFVIELTTDDTLSISYNIASFDSSLLSECFVIELITDDTLTTSEKVSFDSLSSEESYSIMHSIVKLIDILRKVFDSRIKV